jgi:hypothetical protein
LYFQGSNQPFVSTVMHLTQATYEKKGIHLAHSFRGSKTKWPGLDSVRTTLWLPSVMGDGNGGSVWSKQIIIPQNKNRESWECGSGHKEQKRARGMAQVVQHLPSKHKVLSSDVNTAEKKLQLSANKIQGLILLPFSLSLMFKLDVLVMVPSMPPMGLCLLREAFSRYSAQGRTQRVSGKNKSQLVQPTGPCPIGGRW